MTFNAGVGNIRKSDFIQHLKSGDYIKAGESIKTFATSKKFGGLEKRRKDEAKLFLSIF
jgi:GH24 family phage-related lysozyme (muramidase)